MKKSIISLLLAAAMITAVFTGFAETDHQKKRSDIMLSSAYVDIDSRAYMITCDTKSNGYIGIPITWTIDSLVPGENVYGTFIFDVYRDGEIVYQGEETQDITVSHIPDREGTYYAVAHQTDVEGGIMYVSGEADVQPSIVIGTFEQDRKEETIDPIEWQVVTVKDGRALIISKYILKCDSYFDPSWIKYKYCNWEGSIIGTTEDTNYLGNVNGRRVNVAPDKVPLRDGSKGTDADLFPEHCRYWCSEIFYKDAFTEEEKERILLTVNTNPDNPQGVDCGPDTEDYVFFLSYEEILEYWPENEMRKSSLTPQARSELPDRKPIRYWLRTNGEYRCNAMHVRGDNGAISTYGDDVGHATVGYRPAMWITIGG
ncbi:MAG: hypothetical protein IJC48_09390 [Clostridia bacterium]|nr:hypothetical protein [Clostridia bacterium]